MQDDESCCPCQHSSLGGNYQFHQQEFSYNLPDSTVLISVSVRCKQRFSNLHSSVVLFKL